MNGFFSNTNRTNNTNEGAQTGLCHADFTDEWIFLNTNRTNYTNEGAQTGLYHTDFTDDTDSFSNTNRTNYTNEARMRAFFGMNGGFAF